MISCHPVQNINSSDHTATERLSNFMLLTFGETTLISSFKNLNFPTSLWNLRPQFFIQASRTYTRRDSCNTYLPIVQDYAEATEHFEMITTPLMLVTPPIPGGTESYEPKVEQIFVGWKKKCNANSVPKAIKSGVMTGFSRNSMHTTMQTQISKIRCVWLIVAWVYWMNVTIPL